MADPVEYAVQRIKVIGFEPNQSSITFKIEYTKNGMQQSLTKRYEFEDPVSFVQSAVQEIKQQKEMQVPAYDEDFLASYQVVMLKDQEGMEEKLLHFIGRMNERVKLMKKMKDARKYMQMFDEIKVAKMELV